MASLLWCMLGWHAYGPPRRERRDVVLRDVWPPSGVQRSYCAVYLRARCARCGAVREQCVRCWVELQGGTEPNGAGYTC